MTILSLALSAAALAQEPVAVRVGIEAPADTAYELRTPDGRKLGRTGPYEGFAPEDSVDLARESSQVSASFYDERGFLAACPAVEVRVQDAQALCQPLFSLTAGGPKEGSRCSSSCRPLPLQRKRKMERGWFSSAPGY